MEGQLQNDSSTNITSCQEPPELIDDEGEIQRGDLNSLKPINCKQNYFKKALPG